MQRNRRVSDELWIEPGLGPGFVRRGAPECDPVVQPERTASPELDLERNEPIAAPIRRAGDFALTKVLGDALHFRFQGCTACERPRLTRGPGADAALAMARGEIGVGFSLGRWLDRPAHADLASQALPVEEKRRLRVGGKLMALGAFAIRIEDEAL